MSLLAVLSSVLAVYSSTASSKTDDIKLATANHIMLETLQKGAANMLETEYSSAPGKTGSVEERTVEYRFKVHSYGGQPLGMGLFEYDWYLHIDSKTGILTVESFRSDGDVPGQPIGEFSVNLDNHALDTFYAVLSAAKLDQIRPMMGGHPGNTERLYKLELAEDKVTEVVVNDSDHETNVALAPLRQKINRLLGDSFAFGKHAVQLEIQYSRSGPNLGFEVSIVNIGQNTVTFTDPKSIEIKGPNQRAAVLIAEFPELPPGSPPPFVNWQEIPLDNASASTQIDEPLVTLTSGQAWTAQTVAWKSKPGMRYVAYFAWADFSGESMLEEVYRIRGKADSARVVIAP